MQKDEIIAGFDALGTYFSKIAQDKDSQLIHTARIKNPWFTDDNQRYALLQWSRLLNTSKLQSFAEAYKFSSSPKDIGIVMAGNIPLAGLHDLLCVLLAGHKAICKLSADDEELMKDVIAQLISINPAFSDYISISGSMKSAEAMIATGSNNTGRYFEYYFRNVPHIIRKNRNSLALLSGHETPEQLNALGEDIFRYFGLGCRNVSSLLIPEDYDPREIYPHLEPWKEVINHNKYANNYTYHKAILLMNLSKHYDNGFLMMKEDSSIYSPTSCLFYSHYSSLDSARAFLNEKRDEIQCVVTNQNDIPAATRFGHSQQPSLTDFADAVDTMKFLESLSQ